MDEPDATATPTAPPSTSPADPGSTATPTPTDTMSATPEPTATVTVTPEPPADGATLQDVTARLDQLHADATAMTTLLLVVGIVVALGIGFFITKGIRK